MTYNWYRFSAVFYVDASSATTTSSDLGNIAKSKNAGDTKDDALAWFMQHNESWLIVFNNADDTSLDLRKYLPTRSHGSIVITTRNHQMINLTPGAHAHCKILGMLPQEARDLLFKASDVRVTEVTERYGDMLVMVSYISCYPSQSTMLIANRSLAISHLPSSKLAHIFVSMGVHWNGISILIARTSCYWKNTAKSLPGLMIMSGRSTPHGLLAIDNLIRRLPTFSIFFPSCTTMGSPRTSSPMPANARRTPR